MKKILAILLSILLAVAIGAIGFFGYRYYKTDISAALLPEISVNNISIVPSEVAWDAIIIPKYLHKTVTYYSATAPQTIEITEPFVPLQIPSNTYNIVFITKDNEKIFTGNNAAFEAFELIQDGSYTVAIEVHYDAKNKGSGTEKYYFVLNVTLPVPPVEVAHTRADVFQGDAVSIAVKNLPKDEKITVSTDLNTVTFTEKDGVYTGIIAVGYLQSAGKYPVKLKVGQENHDFVIEVSPKEFLVERFDMPADVADSTVNSAAANTEYRSIIHPLYKTVDEQKYWDGAFIQPTKGRISSEFGLKRYINGVLSRHAGIDIATAQGTPVLAPNAGKIEYAGFLQLSGNTIVLDHGGGLKSYFFHMYALHTATGDMVSKQQLIGEVGTTGYSTGNHLHYQLQIGTSAINPWDAFNGTSGIFTPEFAKKD